MLSFEQFKDTVASIDYMHMFPDSHFEEADYHREPMQVADDLADVFGLVLDLVEEERRNAVDKDRRTKSENIALWHTRETLRKLYRQLDNMLTEHYTESEED